MIEKTQYVTKVHLTPDELAKRWSVHPATLRKWRMKAWGPLFIKLGPHLVLYPLIEVENFEKERITRSTAKFG